MIELFNRLFHYMRDALGVTQDEQPICSDYPPIHAVNGEIRLGIEQSKARHPASQETE